MKDEHKALPTMNGEASQALSELEAVQLGRIMAQQFGTQATVEQLTAQRLRLARAFAPEQRSTGRWESGRVVQVLGWLGTRPGAALLGGAAAALLVGVGLGVGQVGVDGFGVERIRSAFQWNDARSVELSPEPLRAVENGGATTTAEASKGTWRNRASGAAVDGWLRAEREPLLIEWVQRGTSVATNSVRLEPGARARVLSAGDDGLVLSLEHGNVVVQGDDAHAPCEVFAGPYSVRSSDAGYELSWSTDTRELALNVIEGQALLEANVAFDRHSDGEAHASERAPSTRQVVSAGQRLRLGDQDTAIKAKSKDAVRNGKRSNALRDPAQSPQLAASDIRSSEKSQVEASTTEGSVASVRPAPVDGGRWKALAESGQYREAVAAATEVGFDAVQATASASDLLLLADAARLGGAPGRARAALQLLRQNFPTHTNAAIAAFTLGRMAQELDHNDRAALKWYRTYLRQEPQGRMAEGARARVLKGALRVGATEEVQAAARDYLAHHPSGSSAALARQSL